MAAIEALEILGQIEVAVIDKLQVVSYKWLSRNFSVSSNQAKRLLQQFVDKNDNKVEVLYSLSGWLKNNSETFSIRLASRQKLEEAKKVFDGNCSIEVYSIQCSLPKDLALLWNAEFVQTENLFNQPPTAENCLRDNRFSSISNCFVKRAVNGQPVAVPSTSPLNANAGIIESKASDFPKDESLRVRQVKGDQFGIKEGLEPSNMAKSFDQADKHAVDSTKRSHLAKESTNTLQAKRKGVSSEKTSSGPGGSLATLWGRASVKSKPSSSVIHSAINVANAAESADAQIGAQEAADDAFSSDEDEYGVSDKRELNGSGTRKRQFIINYSDEEEEDDNPVSLSSPIPSDKKLFSDSLQSTENLNVEKEMPMADKLKAEILDIKKDGNEKGYGFLSEKSGLAEKFLPKAENNLQNNNLTGTNEAENSAMASKRKKVLKTRIDERGREVTEVVWEESNCSEDAGKGNTTKDTVNRPPAAIKEQASGSNAPANTGIKIAAKKGGKGSDKDAKQGKISSFFKKM